MNERAFCHTVLRAPQNMLCHGDLLHLQAIGGPALRSVVTASAAALMRTATKTITGWPYWLKQLREAADKWRPLKDALSPHPSPTSWDSPPIACNLEEASLGFPNSYVWELDAVSLRSYITTQICKSSAPEKVPIQKFIYQQLICSRFHNTLNETTMRRLDKLFQPYELDFTNTISLERCWDILKKNSASVVIRVLKSWCNGWATSYRYQEEPRLPCIFGCYGCKDELAHYLQCPHLYALCKYLHVEVDDDPIIRWGLANPSNEVNKLIACTFSGYHAVRRKFKGTHSFFEPSQPTLKPEQLRSSWSVFADSFLVEARELSFACKQFSLPDFLLFITGDRHAALPCTGSVTA